jgi:hypothetical protein
MPKTKTQNKQIYCQRLTPLCISMLKKASEVTQLPESHVIEDAVRLYMMTYDIEKPESQPPDDKNKETYCEKTDDQNE